MGKTTRDTKTDPWKNLYGSIEAGQYDREALISATDHALLDAKNMAERFEILGLALGRAELWSYDSGRIHERLHIEGPGERQHRRRG